MQTYDFKPERTQAWLCR